MTDTPLGSVRMSVVVAVSPEVAFAAFTDDIGTWYRRGAARQGGQAVRGTLRFAGGVDGCLVEDRDDGTTRERARITVWEPPERLVWVDARETEVDVRFSAVPRGTRLVLEHRGLDRLAPDVARRLGIHGWRRLALWFEQHIADTEAP